jgi:uncharacterized protein (DUF3084 family)
MSTTAWIIVVVVVLVVAALVAWLVAQQRKRKHIAHAEQLREEANQHASEIPEAEVRAKEAEAQAERARLEAERAAEEARDAKVAASQQQAVHEDRLRTADQVDPRVDTSSGDTRADGPTDSTIGRDDPHHTEGTHRA